MRKMKVRDFKKYAVGAVDICDCDMTMKYFGLVEEIPSELLDCRIGFVALGLCSACHEFEGYSPFFLIRLEG